MDNTPRIIWIDERPDKGHVDVLPQGGKLVSIERYLFAPFRHVFNQPGQHIVRTGNQDNQRNNALARLHKEINETTAQIAIALIQEDDEGKVQELKKHRRDLRQQFEHTLEFE